MSLQVNATFGVPADRPWMGSAWPKNVNKEITIPVTTMAGEVHEHALNSPNNRAMCFLEQWYTYKQLDDYATHVAAGFHKLGLKKGDVVALLFPNSMQFVVCYLAAGKLGLIVTGCNPTYKPIEILHQLRSTSAKAIVYLDALWTKELEPIAKDIAGLIKISSNIADFLPAPKRFFGKLLKKIPSAPLVSGAKVFRDFLTCHEPLPEVTIDPQKDDAVYLMTGGSTGIPKVARLTYFNCVANAHQARNWLYRANEGTGFIGVLPYFHAFSLSTTLNLRLVCGSWVILFPKPPKMPELCQQIHDKSRYCTDELIYCGVEVLFQRMADFKDLDKYDLSKLGLCICGAGALHDNVRQAFEGRLKNARLVEGYGLTEASPVVCAGPFYDVNKPGSIGIPFPGTDCKIVDMETGEQELPLGPGNVGELIVHGPQVMAGYLKQDDEDRDIRLINGERWLYTGDLGYMDAEGSIYLCDRKKQLIKHKGYSVFPKEIETLVSQHPAVKLIAAAGIPDVETNEQIKVWIVLNPEYVGKITPEEIQQWCRQNLSHYKVPRYIEFREELPMNAVGKVMRRELQEQDALYIEYHKKKG